LLKIYYHFYRFQKANKKAADYAAFLLFQKIMAALSAAIIFWILNIQNGIAVLYVEIT
jgi:hypothetical protein